MVAHLVEEARFVKMVEDGLMNSLAVDDGKISCDDDDKTTEWDVVVGDNVWVFSEGDGVDDGNGVDDVGNDVIVFAVVSNADDDVASGRPGCSTIR